MNTPWLKTLIFWSFVIGIIFMVFQCTQKSENKKQAPIVMYERLYQCTRDLKADEHQELLLSIQSQLSDHLTQQDMAKLINTCRQANPLKHKLEYIKLIQSS